MMTLKEGEEVSLCISFTILSASTAFSAISTLFIFCNHCAGMNHISTVLEGETRGGGTNVLAWCHKQSKQLSFRGRYSDASRNPRKLFWNFHYKLLLNNFISTHESFRHKNLCLCGAIVCQFALRRTQAIIVTFYGSRNIVVEIIGKEFPLN